MRSRNWLKRIVFGLILFGTLVALCYAGLSFWGRREWARTQAELRARGESVVRSDFFPPLIPDDRNFFATPMWEELSDQVERPAQDGKPPSWEPRIEKDKLRIGVFSKALGGGSGGSALSVAGRQRVSYASPYNLDAAANFYREKGILSPESGNSAADVLMVLNSAQEGMNELRMGSDRPEGYLRFPDEWMGGSIHHVTHAMSINQYLILRVAAEAELGEGKAAEDDILLALRLTEALKTDPFLIVHLVRLSNLSVIPVMLWEGLYRECWNQDELGRLRDAFARIEVRAPYIQALQAERSYFVMTLEPYARAGGMRDFIRKSLSSGEQTPETLLNELVSWLYPTGLVFDDLAYFSRSVQRMIDALEDEKGLPQFREFEAEIVQANGRIHLTRTFSTISLSAFRGGLKRVLEVETRVRQAQVACALESYRLDKGAYPESLAVLPGLPSDPVNGQPFHFRRQPDGGYLLWSVAYNERDDDAKPDERSGDKGDWVWSMPGRR